MKTYKTRPLEVKAYQITNRDKLVVIDNYYESTEFGGNRLLSGCKEFEIVFHAYTKPKIGDYIILTKEDNRLMSKDEFETRYIS